MISLLDGEVGAISKYWNRMSGQIIDLGGGENPLPMATALVDFIKRPQVNAQFIYGDLCDRSLYNGFSEGSFDWVYCNHTLEDLYNPFIVLENCRRIAKYGLFGVPHWTREITVQSNRSDWERICGWPHHFWLIGVNRETGMIEFFPKQSWIVYGERDYKTANLNFEWDGGDLPYKNIYFEYGGNMLRQELIAWLEKRWLTE